jgi:hypothetical protein
VGHLGGCSERRHEKQHLLIIRSTYLRTYLTCILFCTHSVVSYYMYAMFYTLMDRKALAVYAYHLPLSECMS